MAAGTDRRERSWRRVTASAGPAAGGALAVTYLAALISLAAFAVLPVVVGWGPFLVESGSMEPRVRAGDVLVTEPYDGGALPVGSVITYEDPLTPGRLVSHRVVDATDEGFVTRGDANGVDDPAPVPPEAIRGVGRVLVPLVGLPVVWAQQGQLGHVAAFAALSLMALLAVFRSPPEESASARLGSRERRRALGWSARRRLVVAAAVGLLAGAAVGATHADPGPERVAVLVVLASAATAGAVPVALPAAARLRGHRRAAGLAGAAVRTGVALVLAAALVTGVAGRVSAAAYVDTTENAGNSWDAASLEAPTGLTAEGKCVLLDAVVDLSWDAASGATSYEVLRSDTSGGPYTSIGTTSDTTFRDNTTLSLGATYYYVVRSLGGTWVSDFSAEASASTPSLCA